MPFALWYILSVFFILYSMFLWLYWISGVQNIIEDPTTTQSCVLFIRSGLPGNMFMNIFTDVINWDAGTGTVATKTWSTFIRIKQISFYCFTTLHHIDIKTIYILTEMMIVYVCLLPDCPGGGKSESPEGRRMRTVNTAAFPPEHGSIAMGLGAPWEEKYSRKNNILNTISGQRRKKQDFEGLITIGNHQIDLKNHKKKNIRKPQKTNENSPSITSFFAISTVCICVRTCISVP